MEDRRASAASIATDVRVVVGTLRRRMQQSSFTDADLTASQTAALSRLLRDGPASVTDLAKAEGVRSQTMGATVAALEAAGFVVGSPDPNDGRRRVLSITDETRAQVETARSAKEDWLQRVISTRLTPAEQAELASAVKLLQRLAES